MSLSSWYHVTFDDKSIYRDVKPPNSESWNDRLYWKDIVRVCFNPETEYFETDELYIFTSKREESYLIPIEADGGVELWNELIEKKFYSSFPGV